MTRSRRLVAQLLLLPLLWGLATTDTNAFTLVIAAVALVAWALSTAVAAVLVWLARVAEREAASLPEGKVPETLVEAADNAVTMALIATGIAVAAGLAAARVLGLLPPVGPVLLAVLGWALVLVGVPALTWIGTLRHVWLPMLGRGR